MPCNSQITKNVRRIEAVRETGRVYVQDVTMQSAGWDMIGVVAGPRPVRIDVACEVATVIFYLRLRV
jgi:hypothetical protein